MTPQRRRPQDAAHAKALVGFSILNKGAPIKKKTNTSAATDSDQSNPIIAGLMPASLQ
jgi:hypothetical protein